MAKIDLMIVGAQKAGTSSLQNYMYEHPDILGHFQRELAFFTDDTEYNAGFDTAFKKYFTVGNTQNPSKIIAKNATLYTEEHALRRLYAHNPDCKLVFIVRNPTARAYSSYGMELVNGWMTRPFKDLIPIIENNNKEDVMYRLFIKLGLYSNYVQLIHSIFPPENLIMVRFEELQKHPADVCKRMFQLLNISDSFVPDVSKIHNETTQAKSSSYGRFVTWLRHKDNPIRKVVKAVMPQRWFSSLGNKMIEANKSNRKPEPMDEATRQFLDAFFAPYNATLQQLTGLDVSSWSKKKE